MLTSRPSCFSCHWEKTFSFFVSTIQVAFGGRATGQLWGPQSACAEHRPDALSRTHSVSLYPPCFLWLMNSISSWISPILFFQQNIYFLECLFWQVNNQLFEWAQGQSGGIFDLNFPWPTFFTFIFVMQRGDWSQLAFIFPVCARTAKALEWTCKHVWNSTHYCQNSMWFLEIR